jgi:hypothetical protein
MTRRNSPACPILLLVPLGAALLLAQALRADDIKLKDGSKISGTIVGFEENSFKVKTSYGFAIVQKDQVVSISMSDAPKTVAEKTPEPPAAEPGKPASPSKAPTPVPVTAGSDSDPAAKIQPAVRSTPPLPARASAPSKVAAPAPGAPAPPTPVATSAAPAAATAPVTPAAPEAIKEAVVGNTYTNETYRFRMYKPPDWDVIATAPKVLPGAITAMGTGDDMTYLLIGQEPAGKSLATDMDTTEKRLRDVMANFRPLDEKQITVSGSAATEHRFRGSVDQHDWSGVVVLVPRGEKLFTIFGMTRADNDLVQIQENVIARAISSLQFTN